MTMSRSSPGWRVLQRDSAASNSGETLDFARGAERLVLRPVPVSLLLLDLAAGIEEELPGLEVAHAAVQRDDRPLLESRCPVQRQQRLASLALPHPRVVDGLAGLVQAMGLVEPVAVGEQGATLSAGNRHGNAAFMTSREAFVAESQQDFEHFNGSLTASYPGI